MSERSPRRTFGPVVLAGLATAALAAVAASKPWIGGGSTGAADASMSALETGVRSPLASAVALVLLACWGVLLVTRRTVRRVFAVLALVAAVGLVVTVVVGHAQLPDQARDSARAVLSGGRRDTGFTGWFWTAAVASVLALVPAALAVRLAGSWPEMGSRYDAPGARAEAEAAREPQTEQELWKALDAGQDPTDRTTPPGEPGTR